MVTLYAFAATAIVGGIKAMIMILRSGQWQKHLAMRHQILHEWKTVRSPQKLSQIARERKPTRYRVLAALWHSHGHRLDSLLCYCRHARLGNSHRVESLVNF